MGSWSVYCGISKIAITSGQECVLLPLKPDNGHRTYMKWLPAVMPIFGNYDDYGGIEDIVEDDNTKLIESYFGVSIEDFCYYFTRGPIDIEDTSKVMQKNKEVKKWSMMWIDRKVYDFMISVIDKKDYDLGNIDLGNPKILTMLGFTYIGENKNNKTYDPKRYYHEWIKDDFTLFSDGNYIQTENKGVSIHRIHERGGCDTGLNKYVSISQELDYIKDKYKWQLWRLVKSEDKYEDKVGELLYWIMGVDRTDFRFSSILSKLKGDEETIVKNINSIVELYIDNVDKFGDRFADLVTLRYNLHPMSGAFEPMQQYLTPQCGEYEQHQLILNKFAEINKTYLRDKEELDENLENASFGAIEEDGEED
jgi:hypothetical protein